MITLSYSTIQYCLQPENSHNWRNKQMGLQVPDNEYFRNGHRIQQLITDHLKGVAPRKDLAHLEEKLGKFDLFEEEQKYGDPRVKLQQVFEILGEQVRVIGFFDMKDTEKYRSGEIKAYGRMWSVGQFASSYQRKIYGLLDPKFTEGVLITALPNEAEWLSLPPKVYILPYTQKDREDALKWITKAVEVIKKGDFTGGLTDGKCLNRFCNYGENCSFK